MNETGSGSAFVMPVPPTTAKQGEVITEMEVLHKNCEELRMTIGELAQRLEPVLAVSKVGSGQETERSPEPVRAPLADTIHSRSSDVLALTSQVRSLLNRLEV